MGDFHVHIEGVVIDRGFFRMPATEQGFERQRDVVAAEAQDKPFVAQDDLVVLQVYAARQPRPKGMISTISLPPRGSRRE